MFSSPGAFPSFSHHGVARPNATSASYGVSTGLTKSSPQSMDSRGHAICTNASAPRSISIFAGFISEMRNTVCVFPASRTRLSRWSRMAGFPWRPSVPRTMPNVSARFARSTMSRRTRRISPCAYSSRVITRWYGSYLKAGIVGLAIMIASRWNRPSATKTMASTSSSSGRVGAVHPSTSPGDNGLHCGTRNDGYSEESFARTSCTAEAN